MKKVWRWEVITGLSLINGYRYGAELGVSGGRFTSYICGRMPDMRMIAVDLWEALPPKNEPGAQSYDDYNLPAKFDYLKQQWEIFFPGRVQMMKMRTVEAAKQVEDGSLDFIFIDADHTYTGCREDIEAWAPKVRSGGLLSGHDYNWPSVYKAVQDTIGEARVMPDNVWAKFKD